MKSYYQVHPWKVIETGFDAKMQEASESIFSIGNGRMGQRANFEERFSGHTLQGTYVAGVYYPDKTRVGWWKNGYPEYFAKVLNAINWIGIDVIIDGEMLDLNKVSMDAFYRELDMQHGILTRVCTITTAKGKQFDIKAQRFCSIAQDEIGAIQYQITALNSDAHVCLVSYLDADVRNKDANYDEYFWNPIAAGFDQETGYLVAETKKTLFHVAVGMQHYLHTPQNVSVNITTEQTTVYVAKKFEANLSPSQSLQLHKYVGVLASLNHAKEQIASNAIARANEALQIGYEKLKSAHQQAWLDKWDEADIVITGDDAAQQGIRYNIFQLYQTFTGVDDRLNIGPKGFTGEKYGGSTYWDTEAYCLPFYLATANQEVARNLLLYRYKQLNKAIENAQKLGFTNGAALYPMVTMNGEECHNEWEITFEEIHRNGAIAYGIYNYVNYTGDDAYLADYGLEVLIGIGRFWMQRVNWSTDKKQYVMLGVTGPNEYENNINNNWYTNYIARWCLQYLLQVKDQVAVEWPNKWAKLMEKIGFDDVAETDKMKHIIEFMYFPKDDELGIVLQQDGYLDKEQILVKDLPKSERPLNQKWSWDRILRSCFIKQADVLQGFYFFEEDFSYEEHLRNFDFYEQRTVHESSLSPCVHVVLAAKLGKEEKAYEMYLRTSRLDLDDYNHEVKEGLHITSMAGTWLAVVQGFGGMRVKNNKLVFNPMLPKHWEALKFKIRFRNKIYDINISKSGAEISAN